MKFSCQPMASTRRETDGERRAGQFRGSQHADKELVLLIGDDRAIAESTQLIAAGGNAPALDFHARKLQPGQTLQFGWRFDTYATQQK